MGGEIEVSENYFSSHSVRDKQGRDASGKKIVVELLQQQTNGYLEVVSDTTKAQLQQIISGKVSIDSIIQSDGWHGGMMG